MREIKFRAWDKIQKKMQSPDFINCDGDCYDWSYSTNILDYESDRYTLMQYTGLKDKNGKEIYEGDIVQKNSDGIMHEGIAHIKYSEEKAAFMLIGVADWPCYIREGEFEIIGNIYENPELCQNSVKNQDS